MSLGRFALGAGLGLSLAILFCPVAAALATPTPTTLALGLLFFRLFGFGFHLWLIHLGHECRVSRHDQSGWFRYGPRCRLEFFNRKVRRDQERVPLDTNRDAIAGFDLGDVFALLVHEEVHDRNRRFDQHLT